MIKNQSDVQNPLELSLAVRQYLYLCNDSSDIIKFMCDKSNEISSSSENEALLHGDHLDCLNRSEIFQDGRVPSPSSISSLASGRRLEWDSGADVGYHPSSSIYPNTLSTLERMALGGCAEALIRTDPEGTNSCTSGVVKPIHTSITLTSQTTHADSKTMNLAKSVTSPREVSGIINLPMYTNNEAVSLTSDKEEHDLMKHCQNSSANDDNVVHDSIPVSETGTNDSSQNVEKVISPVNTNANENASSDEDVIFKPLRSGMNTNSASSSSLASTIINPNQDSLDLHSKKLRSYKKVITRGIQVGGTLYSSESVQFLESILSSGNSHHAEDENDTCKGDLHGGRPKACKNTEVIVPDSIDTSSFDRANSFEYFPGDMCEKSVARKDVTEKSDFKAEIPQKACNSLAMDLEENIARVTQEKLSNSKKRSLIKEIVERIIESEYCDDFEEKQLPKKSTESSTKSERTTSACTDDLSKLKQSKFTKDDKIYVPYRPIPGGRTYHVVSEKVDHSSETSGSWSETEISRPAAFYLPMDRIKAMRNFSLTSDEREDSVLSAQLMKKRDERINSYLKTLKQAHDQIKKKQVSECSEAESHNTKDKTPEKKYYSSSNGRSQRKSHWWSPDTKSEKRWIDAAKKKQNPVLNYLERERESQLNWIKNEINHLSNLAQLLEECAITKGDSSTSFEDQISLLTSLRKTKKASKNVHEKVDKLVSSGRSSSVEEPIAPSIQHPQVSLRERICPSTSPLLQRVSTQTTSVDYCSNQSVAASSSLPSRTSSRSTSASDPKHTERVHRDKHNNKRSEAYVITFEAGTPEKDIDEQTQMAFRKSLKEVKLKIPSKKGKRYENTESECRSFSSLKEKLEVHRPEFIKNAEERQKCLEELAQLRALRQMTRRKLLHFNLATHQNLHKDKQEPVPKLKSVPSKVIGKSTGKLKENSEPSCFRDKRRYKRTLPEFKEKEAENRKKQYYQTNRLLADIYSKRLQKKVLNGAVSLSISESVISTL